jgi:hypothetical protein
MIAPPKHPKTALTVKFLKAEAGSVSFKNAEVIFFKEGKVYAMNLDVPAPVQDRCLFLALRAGSQISGYSPKTGNGILIGKWVHFVAIDLRLKM